ncbi:MAG: sialate O-acetylesterase [Planctomycetota bacterium]|jgi:sialate O-acetylesterase
MKLRLAAFLFGLLVVALHHPLHAEVRVADIFGDHMVLQQQQTVRVWGWADANESVTVTLGANRATARPGASGRWQVELPPMTASKTPTTITIQGSNTIEIKDVLVGEVWLCSGQSNMEWTVAISANPQEEIAAAKYPLIRHIKIPLVQSNVPLDHFASQWQVCSPETAANFTACGYYMARQLQRELDVPVGLVNSSWGGTRIEPWTPPVGFERVESLNGIYQSVIGRTPGTPSYRERLSAYLRSIEEWTAKAKAAVHTTELLAPSPSYPAELTPFGSNQDPTMLYNGMIHSLVGFPIRGAIWYQGESNHEEGMLYLEKMKALIQGWREVWGQGDFPFYYVQIAPFRYGDRDPTMLARFWEAQAAAQSIPKTGMVVINDIATINDIHPPNKQDVGYRLALLALKNDYGRKELVASSPEFDGLEQLGERLKVRFKNTGGSLKTRDGKSPSHFEVIGPGSAGFHPATATIQGDTVVLASERVRSPVAFRYAWNMLAEPNLTGSTGLPVSACRGGTLPSFFDSVPDSKDYVLVYELDLAKLSANIKYDVDRSDSVPAFDRIGYLVELAGANGEETGVFVSMQAFTGDAKRIGIPTAVSQARFQMPLKDMNVFSNVSGIKTGTGITTGNIEFWPDNYAAGNGGQVVGASDGVYDFGDETAPPVDGYGSMQIHNQAEGQTLFAINHWRAGDRADIGIGNQEGQQRDWTFSANAGNYTSKRLRVYVRPKQAQ